MVIMKIENDESLWDCLKNDIKLKYVCQNILDINYFTKIHDEFKINVLQWLLWHIGSGIRTFSQIKFGNHSRKDWAFHKIEILHENLPKEIWSKIVHSSTGYNKLCKTIHFFTRHAYTVDKNQLDMINTWFDEVNGRFAYSHMRDEHGYTPGDYVNFHRNRQEIFRKKVKKIVDPLVKKYHVIEDELRNNWKKYIVSDFDNYYDWLKDIKEGVEYDFPAEFRQKIMEIAKYRIDSHVIHETYLRDEISAIEKIEEEAKRGLSQNTNHLWIVKIYQIILDKTKEGIFLNNYLKSKKIYNSPYYT